MSKNCHSFKVQIGGGALIRALALIRDLTNLQGFELSYISATPHSRGYTASLACSQFLVVRGLSQKVVDFSNSKKS